MKHIDFRSMLIGFLLCAVGMLTISTGKHGVPNFPIDVNYIVNQVGKYQISTAGNSTSSIIYQTIFDTESGKVIGRDKVKPNTFK